VVACLRKSGPAFAM